MKNILIKQLILITIVIISMSANGSSSPIDETFLKNINSDGDETSCSLTAEGNYFIFARTLKGKENSDLYFVEFKDGKWTDVKAVSDLNSTADDVSPFISSDGKFVLFSSNRPGSLKSNSAVKPSYDIYYSEKKEKGWSKPVLLFGAVNTTDDELNPCLTKDGNQLYFTRSPFDYRTKTMIIKVNKKNELWEDVSTAEISKNPLIDIYMLKKSIFRPGSYISGFKNGDISNSELYYTDNDGGSKISELTSNTVPVNTPSDEISLSEISNDVVIVSSNSKGISASFDFFIKTISFKPASTKTDIIKAEKSKTKSSSPEFLTLKIESENYTDSDGIKIKILYFTSLKKNAWPVKSELQSPDSSGIIRITANPDIKRVLALPGGDGMKSFAVEFLTRNQSITTSVIKIEPSSEKEFTAKSCYFNINSSEIQITDMPYIYELIDYLRKNETARVSLEGYSDGIGSYKTNIDLSLKRAEKIKDYIVRAGIKKNRIRTKGSGYIKDNKSDTQQFNRRVETSIISQ